MQLNSLLKVKTQAPQQNYNNVKPGIVLQIKPKEYFEKPNVGLRALIRRFSLEDFEKKKSRFQRL